MDGLLFVKTSVLQSSLEFCAGVNLGWELRGSQTSHGRDELGCGAVCGNTFELGAVRESDRAFLRRNRNRNSRHKNSESSIFSLSIVPTQCRIKYPRRSPSIALQESNHH